MLIRLLLSLIVTSDFASSKPILTTNYFREATTPVLCSRAQYASLDELTASGHHDSLKVVKSFDESLEVECKSLTPYNSYDRFRTEWYHFMRSC